jgi:16S rRNA G527 N7-methylase RsmG
VGLLNLDKTKLVEEKIKTTPQNVKESNLALFRATMNLPAAAKHCGMTEKEMKLTFREFLKYNEPDYEIESGHQSDQP